MRSPCGRVGKSKLRQACLMTCEGRLGIITSFWFYNKTFFKKKFNVYMPLCEFSKRACFPIAPSRRFESLEAGVSVSCKLSWACAVI